MINGIPFLILIAMTLMGAYAGLCLKKASVDLEHSIFAVLKNYNLYLGAILYIVSAGLNIILLAKMNYSVVLPLTSITYIWTMVFSMLILNEKITIKKIAGVILIIMGAIFIVI